MTTDELFALGLERTRILAAMIDNGRSWYLGRRRRRPEGMISGYFDPKRGLGIDYFRKTIRHLANGGFKKVNMKSDAAVAYRKGNEHVLARASIGSATVFHRVFSASAEGGAPGFGGEDSDGAGRVGRDRAQQRLVQP